MKYNFSHFRDKENIPLQLTGASGRGRRRDNSRSANPPNIRLDFCEDNESSTSRLLPRSPNPLERLTAGLSLNRRASEGLVHDLKSKKLTLASPSLKTVVRTRESRLTEDAATASRHSECRDSEYRQSRVLTFEEELPLLNRDFQIRSRADLKERLYSPCLSPRIPSNAEKFDISIDTPDNQGFKAEIFKSWTAFQLAWKIAHVRAMQEKLALVIREEITDLHLVRHVEDHEVIHDVISKWAPDSKNNLSLVEDATKYDIFTEPADYLPIEMLDTTSQDFADGGSRSRRSSLLRSIMNGDKYPDLQGVILMKEFDKTEWRPRFFRLKDTTLYVADGQSPVPTDEMKCLCNTEESFIYRCMPKFQQAHGAPSPFCFCVIPRVVTQWSEIKCFCADNQRTQTGWFTGFRLSKYGPQLHMNYREAMGKEANLRKTNSARHSVIFRRSYEEETTTEPKAHIDFSGDNGRVLSDPTEVLQAQNELAFEIPKTNKRRSGNFSPANIRKGALDDKQWYHGHLTRDQSVTRLKKAGLKEGLFLVRESSSSAANLVLTVVSKKGKVTHHQIFQSCSHSGSGLFGIEKGPQFSSLELLIAAYHSGAVDGADFTLKKVCPPK